MPARGPEIATKYEIKKEEYQMKRSRHNINKQKNDRKAVLIILVSTGQWKY